MSEAQTFTLVQSIHVEWGNTCLHYDTKDTDIYRKQVKDKQESTGLKSLSWYYNL